MRARRAREVTEITNAPDFHYHVGQLIGAMQMAGYVLCMHEDPKVVEVGQRLWESSAWFFEGNPSPPLRHSTTPTTQMDRRDLAPPPEPHKWADEITRELPPHKGL